MWKLPEGLPSVCAALEYGQHLACSRCLKANEKKKYPKLQVLEGLSEEQVFVQPKKG